MDWTPLTSSNIAACRYVDGLLFIKFHGGSVWQYPATQELYDEFMAAESKGKFFAAKIKGLGGKSVITTTDTKSEAPPADPKPAPMTGGWRDWVDAKQTKENEAKFAQETQEFHDILDGKKPLPEAFQRVFNGR